MHRENSLHTENEVFETVSQSGGQVFFKAENKMITWVVRGVVGHTLGRCRGGEVSYTDQVTDPGKGPVIGMGTKGCCSRKGGHR